MLLSAVLTLPELLAFRLAQSPGGAAYRAFDEATGQWQTTRWAEAGSRITLWARSLAAMQLERQARIAILLPNGLDAVCIDQAALSLSLVPVPLHAIDNPGSIAYIAVGLRSVGAHGVQPGPVARHAGEIEAMYHPQVRQVKVPA